ncbi:type II toxin-antitoxin system Phd/YefM family antitoxin [Aliarcobacter butzleri]|uniref:type II toxin-antitoxin system Phd/YefM family antitoxin n=1 Tax=Aliarcobacter butzleri TaxID=28197 RepID=UPI001ED9FB82|nr:type II toxin-antitoxin system Phd/YefM family antitoxin [Aliarcobacter butzleri]MCG3676669.1 type II toxin-antitoxin system Phd/YefM family antitoxin [Aliarcobacter butzleri]
MNLSSDIKPISYLKSKTAEVINEANENKRAIIITQNGEAKVVIQDIKSYENMQNSINLLKLIVQSENDIENGDVINQEEMFAYIGILEQCFQNYLNTFCKNIF